MVPEPSTEGDISWVNVLDICVSLLLQTPQSGALSPSSISCLTDTVGAQKIFVDKIYIFE